MRKCELPLLYGSIAAIFLLLLPSLLFGDEVAFWRLPVPEQGEPPPERLPPAERIDFEACGLCHPKQMNDWRASRHRNAVSPGLAGQLDAFDLGTQQFCLDCHAPREEQQQRWREGRLVSLDELHGIDCAACHLRKHVHYGPRFTKVTPHGETEQMRLFQDAAFCANCHQFGEDAVKVNGKPLENTYAEWQDSPYAEAGVSCQHCHMPAGRHLFRGIHDPETTRGGLTVRAVRTATGVTLCAGNTGAGHALPTYITPRIRLLISSTATGNAVEHLIHRSMAWNTDSGWEELADTRLLPGEWTALDLDLAIHETAAAEVIVEPDADYRERVYPALLTELSDELTRKAEALLRRAREEAGRSAYVLYRMTCGAWEGTNTGCGMQDQNPGTDDRDTRTIAATGYPLLTRGSCNKKQQTVSLTEGD